MDADEILGKRVILDKGVEIGVVDAVKSDLKTGNLEAIKVRKDQHSKGFYIDGAYISSMGRTIALDMSADDLLGKEAEGLDQRKLGEVKDVDESLRWVKVEDKKIEMEGIKVLQDRLVVEAAGW